MNHILIYLLFMFSTNPSCRSYLRSNVGESLNWRPKQRSQLGWAAEKSSHTLSTNENVGPCGAAEKYKKLKIGPREKGWIQWWANQT